MQAQMFGFSAIDAFYPDIWLNHNDVLTLGKLSFSVKWASIYSTAFDVNSTRSAGAPRHCSRAPTYG